MADNVTTQTVVSTVPDQTKIATDQLAGGEHVQYVKVMDGTLDGTNKQAVTSTGAAKVDGSAVTQPVSGTFFQATQPVSVGAATGSTIIIRGGAKGTTSAADLTGNPIDANTQALHVDGSKVTQPVSGTVTANAGTGTFATNDVGIPDTLGQKTMAGSTGVAIASDQSAVPVSGTVTANQGTPANWATNVAQIGGVAPVVDNAAFTDGTTPVVAAGYILDETAGTALTENDAGAARMDSKRAVVGVIEDTTTRGQRAAVSAANALKVDGSAVTQPVSLAANQSVNIAQYGGTAVTLGQKAMASSEPVVIASDQSAIQEVGNVAAGATDSGNPVKTGAASTFPAIPTLVATGQRTNDWSDLAGAIIVRKRPIAAYSAVFRRVDATAGHRSLSVTFVANTDKQLATVYHAAGSTKRVQIKYVAVTLFSVGTAATLEFEIQRLSATTAPATGNPAITPGKHDLADAAADATCLMLPTTAGSLLGVDSPVGETWINSEGVTSVPTPITIQPRIVLWDSRADGDGKDLILRASNAEGIAVIGRATAGSSCDMMVTIIFTEE